MSMIHPTAMIETVTEMYAREAEGRAERYADEEADDLEAVETVGLRLTEAELAMFDAGWEGDPLGPPTPLLDPADKFDAVIIRMVTVNRDKRRDYAADSDIFSNFSAVADDLGLPGFGATEAAYVNLLTKVARLRALRLNGRMDDPRNESVADTWLDMANYAVICCALAGEK